MKLLPDRTETVTGYRWLDGLTFPLWSWWMDRQERKMFRQIGRGDESRGRALLRQAANEYFDYDDEGML